MKTWHWITLGLVGFFLIDIFLFPIFPSSFSPLCTKSNGTIARRYLFIIPCGWL